MKCALCEHENKEDAKACKKCGVSLDVQPLWQPTWKWHAKTLGIIYVALVVAYFSISKFLSIVPEPYRLRDRPPEITPWLK